MTDKAIMLCTLKLLSEYSDEDHILSMKEIREKFNANYGLNPDRRTIYSAVEALGDMGYDISAFEENGKGYYLRERTFEEAEVKLLVDAVSAFPYISERHTREISEKLKDFLSEHQRKAFSRASVIKTVRKTENAQVIYNIDVLDKAINEKSKISFIYLDYDFDKKLKPRRAERYVVSPYAMTCDGEFYYLISITQGHSDPGFYRIDMMKDIEITGAPLDFSRGEARLDSVKRVVYAHAGAPEQIELHCDKKALRYVIERFGKDITIIPDADKQGFTASFKASPQGVLLWALQNLKTVELKAPESIRKEIIQTIKENHYDVW